MSNNEIVQKLWNLCDVLKDDGINYSEYVTELVQLLFINKGIVVCSNLKYSQ